MTVVTKRWFKQLHDIDAQQAGAGHRSNMMTLVAAGHAINTQTYQNNRTTELVWGEFGAYLRDHSLVGDYATLEKLADGGYRLCLQPSPAGEFRP